MNDEKFVFISDGVHFITEAPWKREAPNVNSKKAFIIELTVNGGDEKQHGELVSRFLQDLKSSGRTLGGCSLNITKIEEL